MDGTAIKGAQGDLGAVGAPGDVGLRGEPGMKGSEGVCIETDEYRQWKSELTLWLAEWRTFVATGGLAPCADCEDAYAEVDAFLDALHTWYLRLLAQRQEFYSDMLVEMQTAFDEEHARCIAQAASQRNLISRQFDNIASQINEVFFENP